MARQVLETVESFPNVTAKDLYDLVVGDCIGSGGYREVFEYLPRIGYVIKVEQHAGCFENVLEYEIWQDVKDTEYAKWFAPCTIISINGIWMVQKRTKPCSTVQLPEYVPAFFTDIKKSNIGWYRGHPCFHDYGRNLLNTIGLTKRMKKIDWSKVNE